MATGVWCPNAILISSALFIIGCGQSHPQNSPPPAASSSTGAVLSVSTTAAAAQVADAIVEHPTEQLVAPSDDSAPSTQAVRQQAEPELSRTDRKRSDARKTLVIANRLQAVLKNVVEAEQPDEEKAILSEIARLQELHVLLAKDIAHEQANPRREGILMPWEFRGMPDVMSATAPIAGFRSPRPTYNLGLSAQLGGEQLASVRREIAESQASLANLRSLRAWAKLTETERTECAKYQPEFAAEASGENARRLAVLSEQIARAPDDFKPHAERADLHWRRGNLTSATADYVRCLQLSPGNDEVRFKYAQLCEQRGAIFNAKDEYRKVAHGKSPLSTEAYVLWGRLLLAEGRIDPAMQAAQLALKSNPNMASAHVLTAELYQRMRIRGQVVDSLQAAVRADPEDASNRYRLANVLAQLSQTQEAEKQYSEAIELDPTWWRPLAGRAALLSQKGEKEAAIADLTAAIEWAPQERSILESRATLFYDLGKEAEAKRDLDAAAKLQ